MSVSVIIPAHNDAEYLKYSLKPILTEYDLFKEIIFVLDRCTDNSRVVIESNMRRNFRVVVKSTSSWRNTCAEAKNFGVTKTKGQIVFHVDADVIADFNPLVRAVALLNCGVVDVVCFSYRFYSLNSNIKRRVQDELINLFARVIRKLKIQPGRSGIYLVRRELAQLTDAPSEYDVLQRLNRTLQLETDTIHLRRTCSRSRQIARGSARVVMPQYNLPKMVLASILQFQPYMLVAYLKQKMKKLPLPFSLHES